MWSSVCNDKNGTNMSPLSLLHLKILWQHNLPLYYLGAYVTYTAMLCCSFYCHLFGLLNIHSSSLLIVSVIQSNSVIYWNSDLFIAILEELVSTGRLAGSLTGGRHDKAMYVPDVYVKAQNDWVDNFYKQNGYLGECSCLCLLNALIF